MEVMEALIYTAETTTDLENVYNDNKMASYSWDEVYAAKAELQALIVAAPTHSGLLIGNGGLLATIGHDWSAHPEHYPRVLLSRIQNG